MVRIRKVGIHGLRRRSLYEVEYTAFDLEPPEWLKQTSLPLFLLEDIVGMQEAYALILAADTAWDGSHGEWVSFWDPPGLPARVSVGDS